MNVEKYQEFANHLRMVVNGERDRCVIDKNLLLTAAAAIDELSNQLSKDASGFHINKAIIMSHQTLTQKNNWAIKVTLD